MQIIVNGDVMEVADALSLAELLDQLGLTGRRLAVEVNAELVPRGRFSEYRLSVRDRVEVIQAIGGG